MKRMRFLTISKKDASVNIAKYGIALAAVLIIGAVMVQVEGENPLCALQYIISGAWGSKTAIGNTIRWTTPYILLGIAASVAFRSGVFNLGLEGQLYWGAWVAAIIGAYCPMSSGLHPIVCILLAGVAGMLYALIPALLKLFFKVNEMISTLMLNYVAEILTEYLTLHFLAENSPANNIQSPNILKTAELPSLIKNTYASIGIFIAICVVAGVWLVYRFAKKGFELKAVGENLKFAKTYGVNAVSTYLLIFLLSGFIAGITGAIEVLGAHHHFTAGFSGNLGWDGVMIAMIAVNDPLRVTFVAALWGTLKSGSLNMERMTSLNRFTIVLIQALFVLFVSIDYHAVADYLETRFKKRKKADPSIRKTCEKEVRQ